jgi:hypothetical protein
MPDDPIDTEVRAGLDDLVPAVDVDAAWTDLTRRFERDRQRRSLQVIGAAAAIVVVLVAAGIGVTAGRSSDADVDVATLPPPAPTEDAEVATEEPPTTKAPSTPQGSELFVSCTDGVGSVTPAVVAASPTGVPVYMEGASSAVLVGVGAPLMSSLPAAGTTGTPWVTDARPATYEVRCGREGGNYPDDPSVGTVEIVDPSGYYTPPLGSTPCDVLDMTYETYESRTLTEDELAAWRFGPAIRYVGYRDAPQEQGAVDGASFMFGTYVDGRKTMTASICPGMYPLPPGDGLAPDDPLRTDADAFVWLEAMGQGPHMALPEGAVVTGRSAKLVRQDERGAVSTAPGFSSWFVRLDYRTAAGVDLAEIYTFSPSGEPQTLSRLSDLEYIPGEDRSASPAWASWFDTLPDHAS